MGWASGSELAEDIWISIRSYIQKKDRKKVAQKIIDLFEDCDCDTIQECESLCEDAEYCISDEDG